MKPWSKEDIKNLNCLQAAGTSIDNMAAQLGRTRDAIKIKLNRSGLEKVRVCKDCGKKIFNAHFNRQRCPEHSKKHTDETSKVRAAINHQKNKKEINNRHLLRRWGKTREIVLKRDGDKCVECGLSREEHLKKYSKDIIVYNPSIKNRKDRKYFKDKPRELITVCLSCQGKLRVKHRSKDYSNCGGKKGMKPETLAKKRLVRCSKCDETFYIFYDPAKNYDRWRKQKCEHCGEKPNYTKKENINFNED